MIAPKTEFHPRFLLGGIVFTPGSQKAMTAANASCFDLLRRHASCDWGDVDVEDAEANDIAVKEGGRIISVYKLRTNVTIWIVTETDRSATTFLLPSEY